jgi:hypothetical protein
MFLQFDQTVAIDNNIVQEYYAKDVQKGAEYIVDECLEGCWCIGESEWHNQTFK